MRCSRGMTLVEVLVVIVIIGALTAGVGFSFGFARDRGAKQEAERLAMGLESFSLVARTTGKRLAWSYEKGSYKFWRRDDDGAWSVLQEEGEFIPRALPDGMRVTGVVWDGQPLEAEQRAPFGVTPPLFQVRLAVDGHRYRIEGNPSGQVVARRENDEESRR